MRNQVLHAALECDARVGGVGSVTVGLTSALSKQGYDISIVTPGYDVYFNKHFKDKHIEHVCNLQHIYKGRVVNSKLLRVQKDVPGANPVFHYLITPEDGSSVQRLFEIQEDRNIYQSFSWSESVNRLEYFNGAIASMLRLPNDKIPTFDLYHEHTWHTGAAGVLAKEMDNLKAWQPLYAQKGALKKIPHIVATIHMLLAREQGLLSTQKSVNGFLNSIGMPSEFAQKFPQWQHYVSSTQLRQTALALLYADSVNTVSEGLADEAINGLGQGLDDLFQWLYKNDRFLGILNGIDHKRYDATLSENLHDFAFITDQIDAHKLRIKQHLATKYAQLDPNKPWFGFIARFAAEKGMDMLKPALEQVRKEGGIMIIMGSHVATKIENGQKIPYYKELIDELRVDPNVLVIDTIEEQQEIGMLVRAAMDCVMMLSHNEACGLPQMEGFANAAFAIGAKIQGLPNSIKDLEQFPNSGSGFLYSDDPATRVDNLQAAIHKAATFYRTQVANKTINAFSNRILEYSKQFDWNANPAKKYSALYAKLMNRPVILPNALDVKPAPMLQMQRPTMLTNPAIKPAAPAPSIPVAPKATQPKIFNVGFNKAGTTTLYEGLRNNGVSTIHYGVKGRSLASIIHDNAKYGRMLLQGVDHFQAYFDMEDIYHTPPIYVSTHYYKQLDKQYPGSKFILNTRDSKEEWIISRLAHKDPITKQSYAEVLCAKYDCDLPALVTKWGLEWDAHHREVREYFKDRPNDFIEYNIDKDQPSKLCNFFADLKLNPAHFKVSNKTPSTHKASAQAILPSLMAPK